MRKVILIGGSPMVGKTTATVAVAAKLKYPCVSTDDIGEALQTVASIDPMQGKKFREYYANTPPDKLLKDIHRYHEAMEPALTRLIEIHSTWGNPVVIEGWALYPRFIKPLLNKNRNIFAFWLIAGDVLFESRLASRPEFLCGDALRNYLSRSKLHNDLLLRQCIDFDCPYYLVTGREPPELLAREILSRIN